MLTRRSITSPPWTQYAVTWMVEFQRAKGPIAYIIQRLQTLQPELSVKRGLDMCMRMRICNIYNMASRYVSAIYDPNTEILARGEAEG